MSQVDDGSETVIATYYYDPFGRRLWKSPIYKDCMDRCTGIDRMNSNKYIHSTGIAFFVLSCLFLSMILISTQYTDNNTAFFIYLFNNFFLFYYFVNFIFSLGIGILTFFNILGKFTFKFVLFMFSILFIMDILPIGNSFYNYLLFNITILPFTIIIFLIHLLLFLIYIRQHKLKSVFE